MRIPIHSAWREEAAGLYDRFFPVMILSAMLTGGLVSMAWSDVSEIRDFWRRLALAILPGLPALFILAVVERDRNLRIIRRILIRSFVLLLLAWYFLLLPSQGEKGTVVREMLLVTGLVLGMVAAPYSRRGEGTGLWEWGRALVLALAPAIAYPLVMATGLSAALAGAEYLLGIDVPGQAYASLWIVFMTFISVVVFLAGIPEKVPRDEAPYPEKFGAFVSWSLVPIVWFYLLILYAYAAIILVRMSWPKGGVAGFTIGFSAVGIAAIALLHPVRDTVKGRLARVLVRFFFPLAIPLSGILLLAVLRRVSEYGITESRYLGILLALWLGGMSIYLQFIKVRSIRTIPVTLGILSVLAAFGPWGALEVSERSQVARLKTLLVDNGLLREGRIVRAQGEQGRKDQGEISRIVHYLFETHGPGAIRKWFPEGAAEGELDPDAVFAVMGLKYDPYAGPESAEEPETWVFRAPEDFVLVLDGFEYQKLVFVDLDDLSCLEEGSLGRQNFTVRGKSRTLRAGKEDGKAIVYEEGRTLASFDLLALARELADGSARDEEGCLDVPQERMSLTQGEGDARLRLALWEIRAEELEGEWSLHGFSGALLFSKGQ